MANDLRDPEEEGLPAQAGFYPALQALVSALEWQAVHVPGLFSQQCESPGSVARLKHYVLAHGALPQGTDAKEAAQCLLALLRSMPEPLVDKMLYSRLLLAMDLPEPSFRISAVQSILQGLSYNNLRTLKYFVFFLHRMLFVHNLALADGQNLLRLFHDAIFHFVNAPEQQTKAGMRVLQLMAVDYTSAFLDPKSPLPLEVPDQMGFSKGTILQQTEALPPRQTPQEPPPAVGTPLSKNALASPALSQQKRQAAMERLQALEVSQSIGSSQSKEVAPCLTSQTQIKVIRDWLGERTGQNYHVQQAQQSIDDLMEIIDNAPLREI